MQVLDSLIDGPLRLRNRREGDELIGMIVRYLVTGEEPEPRTDAQEAVIVSVWPVMKTSYERRSAGSSGGSKSPSKTVSKQGSKTASKRTSKQPSKTASKAGSSEPSKRPSGDDGKPASKRPSNDVGSGASKSPSKPASKRPSEEEEELGRGTEEQEEENPLGRSAPREGDARIPFEEIVQALNDATGKSFRASSDATRRHISARWREGYRLQDFERVIATKTAEWAGTERDKYLRPETLFGPKFESYLNQHARPDRLPRGVVSANDEYSRL